ncbi:MAG: 2-C-methyl-D-erythritol 2,4-cyclodiphosphate synthase [candidate division WOR-3 bacterium]
MRVGIGFDAHNLRPGRRLIIGGTDFPSRKGLQGYSDADVLLHAICDSILGALAQPDIGVQFANTNPKYRGADSAKLLKTVMQNVRRLHWRIINVDCTIICDQPKVAPYASTMKKRIACLLSIDPDRVGIKAKTTEGTGLAHRRRSIAALTVVLLGRP